VGGNLRDVEIRKGQAISVYVHDKITLSKKLDVNMGVRYEQFGYGRNILRGRFNVNGMTIYCRHQSLGFQQHDGNFTWSGIQL